LTFFPAVVLAKLPKKTLFQKSHLAERTRGLERFLNSLLTTEIVKDSEILSDFFLYDVDTFKTWKEKYDEKIKALKEPEQACKYYQEYCDSLVKVYNLKGWNSEVSEFGLKDLTRYMERSAGLLKTAGKELRRHYKSIQRFDESALVLSKSMDSFRDHEQSFPTESHQRTEVTPVVQRWIQMVVRENGANMRAIEHELRNELDDIDAFWECFDSMKKVIKMYKLDRAPHHAENRSAEDKGGVLVHSVDDDVSLEVAVTQADIILTSFFRHSLPSMIDDRIDRFNNTIQTFAVAHIDNNDENLNIWKAIAKP
jgi:hypothetical protein